MNRILTRTAAKTQSLFYSTSKPTFEVFPGAYLNRTAVTTRVVSVVESCNRSAAEVSLTSSLAGDLRMDSQLRKQLNEKLAEEFAVRAPKDVQEGFVTVQAVVDYFATNPKAR
jgi:acyl carrier protein